MRHYLIVVSLLLFQATVFSQTLLPTPRNVQKAYDKGSRSTSGSPGAKYWQNSAVYDLKVDYDPATRLIKGVADIVYVNNSPDALERIWFKIYPNYYQRSSPRQSPVEPDDLTDGMVIDSLSINQQVVPSSTLRISYTNASVKPNPAVAPNEKIRFRIVYHYTLNKGSHMRTGEIEPGAAFIAYFFPRVAVYDDIDGWNTIPYTGTQEFYNDFCHFSAAITVPANFIVWATGDLVNVKDVLSPLYQERLQQAETRDELMYIIDSNDLKKGGITPSGKGSVTWHYDADEVTDFAFAVSDHYLWQSSSVEVDHKTKRRTRVDAVFNPVHEDYFLVGGDARKTVDLMSHNFPAWPFPYPHITVFDGLDQMEYPMMVNDNPVTDRKESVSLTDHEIFHTMFPFYMGINETKYAWMDEGWATIGEWLLSPMIDSTIVDEYGVAATAITAGNEMDLPIVTPSTETNRAYFTNAYPKPAMGYLFIKDYLGETIFNKALHHYITEWHGKHPAPNDFFYSMNKGAGKNLNWFWKKWFFEGGIPDLALTSVKVSGITATVVVTAKGSKPVPVDLMVEYKSGATQKIHRSIAVWEKGNKTTTIRFTAKEPIKSAVLGDPHTPDSNPADNGYSFKK